MITYSILGVIKSGKLFPKLTKNLNPVKFSSTSPLNGNYAKIWSSVVSNGKAYGNLRRILQTAAVAFSAASLYVVALVNMFVSVEII